MALNLMEPPEWWVKYKPLRWIFGFVVLLWLFSVLWPRLRSESPPPPTGAAQSAGDAFPTVPATEAPAVVTAPPAPKPVTPPPTPKPVTPPPAPKAVPPPAAPKPVTPPPAPKPVAPATPPPEVVAKAAPPAPTPANPAARFTAVEADRVVFMERLRSYDSVEKVQEQLGAAGFRAEQSTIEKKVSRDRYPPFRSDTLLVPNYKHGEHEGKLTLEFFNDRLYQAQFIPKDPKQYLQWLRRNVPLARRPSGRSSFTQGPLQVVSNIDFATSEVGSSLPSAPFVMWEDTRLVQQMREWGPLR